MATMSYEKSKSLINEPEFDVLDVFEVDETLLKALLDEPLAETDGEDERLGSVIRSLEEEIIDPKMADNRCLIFEPEKSISEHFEDNKSEECSISCQMEDFDWIDMDIDIDCISYPSDDMGNWFKDTFTDEIGSGMIGFGDDYSQFYCGIELDEVDHAYSSLWQETYETTMYS